MRVLIIILFFSSSVQAENVYGIPKIIDGDTVHIDEYKIRLEGIDAPEIKQRCKKESLKITTIIGLTFYKDYYCGKASKEKLKKKINNKIIKCDISSIDRYKRRLATCYKGKLNLNKWMVRNGYAVAYKRYSKRYITDEDFAKENRLGLWKGKFILPEKWRKLN